MRVVNSVVRVVLFLCVVSVTVSLYAIEKHLSLASQALALMTASQGVHMTAPAARPTPTPEPLPDPLPLRPERPKSDPALRAEVTR